MDVEYYVDQDDEVAMELKEKKICRFCLSQTAKLTSMFDSPNRGTTPLGIQAMACASLEISIDDELPSTICEMCRLYMDMAYRFRIMCKKADTMLKQYPFTRKWPPRLPLPRIPVPLVKMAQAQMQQQNLQATTPVQKPTITKVGATTIVLNKSNESANKGFNTSQLKNPQQKILNKNPMKILNTGVKNEPTEPILGNTVVTTDERGNIEIVTEFLDSVQYIDEDHIKKAAPVKTDVFPCTHCDRSFPLKQLLDIHVLNHTRERHHECNLCDKRFFSKYDLGKHMLTHTGEKPFVCIVCNKAFSRSTLLHRHEKIHTDQPKFLCSVCERTYLSEEALKKHFTKHEKKRPFSCSLCPKSFAYKQGLERHLVLHEKDQPHPCEYCDKSFPSASKLARHLTAHAGRRPYPCRFCPKSYLLSHHLSRHMRSHNSYRGSYKCYECEDEFNSRDDLIYHSAMHATESRKCPLCKEQYDDIDGITEHMKSHSEGDQYACEFCDLIFATEEKLCDHSEQEHADDQRVYENDDNTRVVKRETTGSVDTSLEDSIDEDEEDGLIENQNDSKTKNQNANEKKIIAKEKEKSIKKENIKVSLEKSIKKENISQVLDKSKEVDKKKVVRPANVIKVEKKAELNANDKSGEEAKSPSPRRSSRIRKEPKDYKDAMKVLQEDEDEEEEDADDDHVDADFTPDKLRSELIESDDDEPNRKKRRIARPNQTQSKTLIKSEPAEKPSVSASVQNVIKNIPKGVTVKQSIAPATLNKLTSIPAGATIKSKVVGNKTYRTITMTKSDIARMEKEGKIAVKPDGTFVFKTSAVNLQKK